MTLSKQLLLLISALFLMIFSVNFVLSVNNIKAFLESEAEVHAQDTATSLGLSLSPYMINETDPVIETMMNAIFDMGYYQEIKLLNVEEKPLVTLSNKIELEGVPNWFIEMIPMKKASAGSEINAGWNISGVVYVTINSGNGYLKLYEQAKSSFYYSLMTLIVAIGLLLLVLRITLSPLKTIEKMAGTLADGKFETIEKLPWTTEVRNVTVSMNMMSKKIEAAITSLNLKLESVGTKLQQDELTGLKKKNSFQTEMKQLFSADTNIDAYIMMIKIDGLSGLVKELGTDAIDTFLKDFALVLKENAAKNDWGEILAYRFVGAEFVLLIKQVNLPRVELLAKRLSAAFSELGEQYGKPDIAHIGVVPFNPVDSTENILLAAKEAYEQAQLIGANSYYVRTGDDPAIGIAEWKRLVFDIIDKQKYSVTFISKVEHFETQQVFMEEAFTKAKDEKGNTLLIGTFISIAEKFEKIIELDKGVILKVIDYIETENIDYPIAINMATRTIKNSDFREWLVNLVGQKQNISQQLVFNLSAYAIAKDMASYKEFIEFVHKLNMKVMIKRFETQSLSAESVKQLKPDFIRLARDLGQGVADDEEKKEFVEGIKSIGELLNISILAENINTEDDFICMKKIGITGVSR